MAMTGKMIRSRLHGDPGIIQKHAVRRLVRTLDLNEEQRAAAQQIVGNAVQQAHDLHRAMEAIAEDGRGVVVLIREPRPTSLSDLVRDGLEKEKKGVGELREYGIGAQILLDLGVKEMVLLSNTKRTTPRTRIVSLEGYGLSVVGRHSIGNGDSEDG